MKNKVQLITYVDRLGGGNLTELHRLLDGPLAGLFGGVHLVPFYYPIHGADSTSLQEQPGLIPLEELDALVERIHMNSNGQSRQATGAAASNLDLYQVNCTFYDALGRNDHDYLLVRAIQFFTPGIPQVYYVGLLAGENDMALLSTSGIGRDINRHYYTPEEIDQALQRPVVQSLFELIRFRNGHRAFDGMFSLPETGESEVTLRWDNGDAWVMLEANFASGSYQISSSP